MSAFWEGFEKRAGFIQRLVDKARSSLTGMERVYHGTSGARAQEILQKGLKPNIKGGIAEKFPAAPGKSLADANKGLVFTTKDKHVAKGYAKQQVALDAIENVHGKLKEFSDYRKIYGKGKVTGAIAGVLEEMPILKAMVAQRYARIPFAPGGKVLKMDLPKDVLKKSVPNPEVDINKKHMGALMESLPVNKKGLLGRYLNRRMNKAVEAPFKHDVVIKGKIKPDFIKG